MIHLMPNVKAQMPNLPRRTNAKTKSIHSYAEASATMCGQQLTDCFAALAIIFIVTIHYIRYFA